MYNYIYDWKQDGLRGLYFLRIAENLDYSGKTYTYPLLSVEEIGQILGGN